MAYHAQVVARAITGRHGAPSVPPPEVPPAGVGVIRSYVAPTVSLNRGVGTHAAALTRPRVGAWARVSGLGTSSVIVGAPNLPGNQTVGRPASQWVFLGDQGLLGWQAADFARWKSQLGFAGHSTSLNSGTLGHGNGLLGGKYRLKGTSALANASDTSFDWQRAAEGANVDAVGAPANSGPFYVKKNSDPSLRVWLKVKLHKRLAGTDQGPWGYDWWDDAGWAVVYAEVAGWAAGLKFLGGEAFHYDPEFGHWDIPVTAGHTQAQQFAKIEQRGYEFEITVLDNYPAINQSIYGWKPGGTWHEEVGANNGGLPAIHGDPALTTALKTPVIDVQRDWFMLGMWRAMAERNAPGWFMISDAFFYREGTQYSGVSYDTAMRWNLWGVYSWVSRVFSASSIGGYAIPNARTTRDYILPHLLNSPTAWAGTDNTNFYYTTQRDEPTYGDMLQAHRKWGMGGLRTEYFLGDDISTQYTESVGAGKAGFSKYAGAPDNMGRSDLQLTSNDSKHNQSYGKPTPGLFWGRNLYTGADYFSRGIPDLGTHTSPVDGHVYEKVSPDTPAGRTAKMLTSVATTPLASAPPAISNLVASVSGGNATITCQVRHGYAPWFVKVHRGLTWQSGAPESSKLGCMAMVFRPNNGTDDPAEGMADPYMDCSFTTIGGGFTAGEWFVVQAVSVKEDVAWARIQVPGGAPPPTVPGIPVLAGTAGDTVVDLSWSPPSSGGSAITSYKVYRGPTLISPAGWTLTTYHDTGRTNQTNYSYQVSAVNAVGEGSKSNVVSVTPVAGGSYPARNDPNVGSAAKATLTLTPTNAANNAFRLDDGMGFPTVVEPDENGVNRTWRLIQNRYIPGCLRINITDPYLLIRNCYIESTTGASDPNICSTSTFNGRWQIDHCTIHPIRPSSASSLDSPGIDAPALHNLNGSPVWMHHCEITETHNISDSSNGADLYEWNWMHRMRPGTDAIGGPIHKGMWLVQGGNGQRFRHNRLELCNNTAYQAATNPDGFDGACHTGWLFQPGPTVTNVTIDSNFIWGGVHQLRFQPTCTNMTVTNNVFGPPMPSGDDVAADPATTIAAWSGNVRGDTAGNPTATVIPQP